MDDTASSSLCLTEAIFDAISNFMSALSEEEVDADIAKVGRDVEDGSKSARYAGPSVLEGTVGYAQSAVAVRRLMDAAYVAIARRPPIIFMTAQIGRAHV